MQAIVHWSAQHICVQPPSYLLNMITEQAVLVDLFEYLDFLSESHGDGDLHKRFCDCWQDCLPFWLLWQRDKIYACILIIDAHSHDRICHLAHLSCTFPVSRASRVVHATP